MTPSISAKQPLFRQPTSRFNITWQRLFSINSFARFKRNQNNLPGTATASVLRLPELLDMIFNYLDFNDLLRVTQVCKLWNDSVQESPYTKPRIFKTPKLIKDGSNPHFESFSFIEERLSENSSQASLRQIHSQFLSNEFYDASEHRRGVQDRSRAIRRGAGPISTLIPYYCQDCHSLHEIFQYQHLHPLLRFLGKAEFLCIKGFDSTLSLNFESVDDDIPQPSDIQGFYELHMHIVDIRNRLFASANTAWASDRQADQFTQPATTTFHLEESSQICRMRNRDLDGGVVIAHVLQPIMAALWDYHYFISFLVHGDMRNWARSEGQERMEAMHSNILSRHPIGESWENVLSATNHMAHVIDDGLEEWPELIAKYCDKSGLENAVQGFRGWTLPSPRSKLPKEPKHTVLTRLSSKLRGFLGNARTVYRRRT
jgi:hypothetical protein